MKKTRLEGPRQRSTDQRVEGEVRSTSPDLPHSIYDGAHAHEMLDEARHANAPRRVGNPQRGALSRLRSVGL